MNILEFYRNLNNRQYEGINFVLYKDNINRNKIENILKRVYLKGCSVEFNFFIFDLEEQYDISLFSSALQSYSFGCNENLIIVYSFESLNANNREELISYVKKAKNCNIFIFSKEKYKIFNSFNKIEIVSVSKRPSDIKTIVKSMSNRRGIELNMKNINMIVQLYGNDIEKIDRVLEQVELLGEAAAKEPDLFIRIIGEGSQISFYKMSKSFLDKDINGVRENIDNLLNWGVHPVIFLAMFKKMILKIVAVYEGERLRGDYLEEKYERIARGMNKKRIEKLFDLFYNMEYKLRVIGIDRDVIDFYTLEILKAI